MRAFGRLRNAQTLLRVFEDRLDLFALHPLEPFEKIIHRGAAFKILEERGHWNARAFKQPRSADFSRHALDAERARLAYGTKPTFIAPTAPKH